MKQYKASVFIFSTLSSPCLIAPFSDTDILSLSKTTCSNENNYHKINRVFKKDKLKIFTHNFVFLLLLSSMF